MGYKRCEPYAQALTKSKLVMLQLGKESCRKLVDLGTERSLDLKIVLKNFVRTFILAPQNNCL